MPTEADERSHPEKVLDFSQLLVERVSELGCNVSPIIGHMEMGPRFNSNIQSPYFEKSLTLSGRLIKALTSQRPTK